MGAVLGSPPTRRDPLTSAELRQARAWRARGASWDAVGKMLGRAGLDVRAAVDGPLPDLSALPCLQAVARPKQARPKGAPRDPTELRSASVGLRVLALLVRAGVDGTTAAAVAAVIRRRTVYASVTLNQLKHRGLAVRTERGRPKIWTATKAGVAEAARHRVTR